MAKSSPLGLVEAAYQGCLQSLKGIAANLQKNNLWKRILKNTISLVVTFIIALVPATVAALGKSGFLGSMTSVFGCPGQRFGKMAESQILIVIGSFGGIAWSNLGLYLSNLLIKQNPTAAYAIRAVFLALAIIVHGLIRASLPRLFPMVFFGLLLSLSTLTGAATQVTAKAVSQLAYPIIIASGVVFLVNILIFPESSSDFLGKSIIETLNETVKTFREADEWFMSDHTLADANENGEKTAIQDARSKLAALTEKKSQLRTKLASTKAAQAECNFELVFAVLPPRSLKPISCSAMASLVATTISLINACESKYALEGDDPEDDENQKPEEQDDQHTSSSESSDESSADETTEKPKKKKKSKHARQVELVKPLREIESGDIEVLERMLSQVRVPAKALEDQIHRATEAITAALSYCLDVPTLPSGCPAPQGVQTEELDIRIGILGDALEVFDRDSSRALEHAAVAWENHAKKRNMPRMESHLIASFMISTRQVASHIHNMLKLSRSLVERRESRGSRKRLYYPKISWKKWLTSGGEQDANALPENARKEARAGRGMREDLRAEADAEANSEKSTRSHHDEETGHALETTASLPERGRKPPRQGPQKKDVSYILWARGLAADTIEFFGDSDALSFALKMSVAAWIVTWPPFIPSWNAWYAGIRGNWATLQLILVFEVSVGTSFQGFIFRATGTILGCTLGYIAWLVGHGDRAVMVVILALGVIPASYIQLSSPYVKVGVISQVSLAVVGLATIVGLNNDEPWQLYLKRMLCFLVGGIVALVVEMCLFPVRARDRLVESLASTIQQISEMEASIAVGIDSPRNIDIKTHALNSSFTNAKDKAEQALSAARTFLPVCLKEPRLKGNFKGQALVYGEMIYVLFQIIERMDSLLQMRKSYGSSVLEEMHGDVLPYRRNVAGSTTLTLFAVHEALTTRLPLPQFLPSARTAHLRYMSHVRELLVANARSSAASSVYQTPAADSQVLNPLAHDLKSMKKQSFLSWNAGSAAMMEIIEYVEELVDLAKLLVGVNAFRSGMLERPKFHEYMDKAESRNKLAKTTSSAGGGGGGGLEKSGSRSSGAATKPRGFSFGRSQTGAGAGLKRRQTFSAQAAAEDDENAVEDDIPMSLQRVKTKRMEGREMERLEKKESSAKKQDKVKIWGA